MMFDHLQSAMLVYPHAGEHGQPILITGRDIVEVSHTTAADLIFRGADLLTLATVTCNRLRALARVM